MSKDLLINTFREIHSGKRGGGGGDNSEAMLCLLNCPLQHSMMVAEGVSQLVQLPIVRVIIHNDEVVVFAECESILTLDHGRGGIWWG